MTSLRFRSFSRTLARAAAIGLASACAGSAPPLKAQSTVASHAWEQTDPTPSFTLAVERQVYTPLDRAGRIVAAVQVGKGASLSESLLASCRITRDGKTLFSSDIPLSEGLGVLDFDLTQLTPGTCQVTADFIQQGRVLHTANASFDLKPAPPVKTAGRIPLILPQGHTQSGFPISVGVPFPKGALSNTSKLRLVTPDGKPVPFQTSIRGRWGFAPSASIRWLGIDFIPDPNASGMAWWPSRSQPAYFLEFGPDTPAQRSMPGITLRQTSEGIRVDTGQETTGIAFLIRNKGFNLIDEVTRTGQTVSAAPAGFGPYLVDHQGSVYRAANDNAVTLTIEESGPIKAVIRAEGWYVKDGSLGQRTSPYLPTDRLCKFITRIEAYQGKPFVRVLHTWVFTFDSFTVRLRDVGFSIPAKGAAQVSYAIESAASITTSIPAQGVHLLQHRPDQFDIQTGSGAQIASGKHSAGSATVTLASPDAPGLLNVSHRETWQRFPKEIQALPDQLRLHIWPQHGKSQPDISPFAPDRFHQIWFLHQGQELNLRFPWEVLFSVIKLVGNPSLGIYQPGGTVMGGVHSSAMGISITSDFLLQYLPLDQAAQAEKIAQAFQRPNIAVAHPRWTADSLALGPIHPYDPNRFAGIEAIASDSLKGYRDLQNATGEYGMFLYRTWHHSSYIGSGVWEPYRLYNAGHHYEPYMPWLYFARSGDPDYLEMGMANLRHFSDLALIHYNDPTYPHREFYSNQGRIIGSTKHTNGFVTWGGDHALLGHLTCYNALMLGYYITGDHRFKECVLEWQNSIVANRSNPQFAPANRATSHGRDTNNALGELIDLYQLTWDPRLLAHIQPLTHTYRGWMYNWGIPVQNIVGFSGDPKVQSNLITAALERRQKPTSTRFNAFTGVGAAGSLAITAGIAPEHGFDADALLAANLTTARNRAKAIIAQAPGAGPMCRVPDDLVYFPLLLHAIAQSPSYAAGMDFNHFEALPIGDLSGQGHFTRIILREDKDQPITLFFRGTIASTDVELQAFDPSGNLVLRQPLPPGANRSATIPPDSKTGQYVLLIRFRDSRDHIIAPVSNLPAEVYAMSYFAQDNPSRLFVGVPNTPDNRFAISIHGGTPIAHDAQGKTPLIGQPVRQGLSFPFAAPGIWLTATGRYISSAGASPMIFSLSPDRFFNPTPQALSIQPLPPQPAPAK